MIVQGMSLLEVEQGGDSDKTDVNDVRRCEVRDGTSDGMSNRMASGIVA